MKNKIKIGLITVFALLNCNSGYSQSTVIQAKIRPYTAGEELSYSLKLGPIHAGEAR